MGPMSTYHPRYGVFKTVILWMKQIYKRKQWHDIEIDVKNTKVKSNKTNTIRHLHERIFFSAARNMVNEDDTDDQFNQHRNQL